MTVTGGKNPESGGREEPSVGPATPSGTVNERHPEDQLPLSLRLRLIVDDAYVAVTGKPMWNETWVASLADRLAEEVNADLASRHAEVAELTRERDELLGELIGFRTFMARLREDLAELLEDGGDRRG